MPNTNILTSTSAETDTCPDNSLDSATAPAGELSDKRIFMRAAIFWHVLTLGMLGFFLGFAVWDARANLGWRQAGLTVIVLLQLALYLKCFVWNRPWPGRRRWHIAHFAGGLALTLLAQRIDPGFLQLGWMYFGQSFSLILPPTLAIPYMGIWVFTYIGYLLGWNPANYDLGTVLGFLFTFAGAAVFYSSQWSWSQNSEQRVTLIRRLRAANQQLEASRLRDAELAMLRERERIARDMHDNLGHSLVAMTIQLEAIQRLYKVDPPRAEAQIDQLKQLTRDSTNALRRSLDGLRAPSLGGRDLPQAVKQLGIDIGQRSALNVDCAVDDAARTLPHELADALWCVAQEGLTNVEKHARAKHVGVQLRLAPAQVVLVIEDDGVGFAEGPAEAGPTNHYGLLGMRERLESLGGRLSIRAGAHARGTRVEAIVPTPTE